MTELSAKDAKAIAEENAPQSGLLPRFFEEVEATAKKGLIRMKFYPEELEFTSFEREKLQKLGYGILANGGGNYYEINW